MTRPTSYNPQTSFGDDEAADVSGRDEIRTTALDVELNAIALTLGQIIGNLTSIQRDDNALLDGVVTVASMSSAVQAYLTAAGGQIRGAWLTLTVYAVKDVVTNGTGTYICAVGHTAGVFATDKAAGKWVTLFDSSAFQASAVAFTPTGNISATTVQAALAEVDAEKMAKAANLSDISDVTISRANLGVQSIAQEQSGAAISAVNSGTADALVGAFTPTIGTLTNNMMLVMECNAANTSTVPTFTPNGVLPIAAKTIVRPDGSALLPGDIPGANFKALLCYDTSLDKWVLINAFLLGAAGVIIPGANRMINSGFGIDQRVNAATARADDTYCLDFFYVLTQTASVQVTQQALQENGSPFNIRLNQNQAAAQRMGVAQIIEAANCLDLRGQLTSMAARVRISSSQALRFAILEWTGAADTVTSDVVNDWTSASYTAGGFFLGASLTVSAVGTLTPAANTWTDLTTLQATLGNGCNNIILFIWTEQVAAQNVTLDIARWRYAPGAVPPTFRQPDFAEELLKCQRWYYKTFPLATAPAQNAGRAGDWEITGPAALSGSLGSFELPFATRMRAAPAITFYNPAAANASARDFTNAADRAPTTLDTSDRRLALTFATLANGQVGIHITADASL